MHLLDGLNVGGIIYKVPDGVKTATIKMKKVYMHYTLNGVAMTSYFYQEDVGFTYHSNNWFSNRWTDAESWDSIRIVYKRFENWEALIDIE